MEVLRIVGGQPLRGTVVASGAKNAALPIMAACLLVDEPVELLDIPEVTDVATLSRVLGKLGVDIFRSGSNQLSLRTYDLGQTRANWQLVRRMRASFCVLGPLLARRGKAIVPLPGGCSIGNRPIDLHLRGLAALGADLRIARGHVIARAARLRGARIDLLGPRGPSVTGTANVLSAAVLARGETRIQSAAREPEIVDLGNFLIRLGARIEGLGSSEIIVRGVRELEGGTYRVIPDRIEAGTLLMAAAATAGAIRVHGARAEHLGAVLEFLQAMGCELAVEAGAITLTCSRPLRPVRMSAEPYPGIPTDLQPQFMALASLAGGTSQIRDIVFPARLDHLRGLRRLGARIAQHGPNAGRISIQGVRSLVPARVTARDLRSGAALVLAALATPGTSTIRGLRHIERGYEHLDRKLAQLGAAIKIVSISDSDFPHPGCLPEGEGAAIEIASINESASRMAKNRGVATLFR